MRCCWTMRHGSMASPRQTAAHPTVLFARIEEDPPLGVAMGLDFTTVQRMFGASLVASVGVFILQGSMMDAVLTLIALCALSAMIWGLSERSETFSALRLTGSGRGKASLSWSALWRSLKFPLRCGPSLLLEPTSFPCRSLALSGSRDT